MKKIFDYSDFRQYLQDFYETQRLIDPSVSYRGLAAKSGIKSPTFFKSVMEGKRNLTPDTITKACAAFDLKGREAEYFKNLVQFNQSKSVKSKNQYFDKLIKLQKEKNVYTIQESQYEYFSQWYHCIIRELVTYDTFKGDFKKLAKSLTPSILPYQAKNSVKLLLKLGFLNLENGKYVQSEPVISTGPGVNKHQIINFQIAMLKKAVESFDNLNSEERLTSSNTVSLSQKSFSKLVGRMREFQSEMLEEARQETNPERAYQVNMNFFAVSKGLSKGGSK